MFTQHHIILSVPFPHERIDSGPHGVNLNAVIGIPEMLYPVQPALPCAVLQISLLVTGVIDLKEELPDLFIFDIRRITSFRRIKCHRGNKPAVAGMPDRILSDHIIVP